MHGTSTRKLTSFGGLSAALALLAGTALGATRLTQAVVMSAAISKPAPVTPRMALQLKVFGSVQRDVTIDEHGIVEKTEALRGNPILSKAAQDAVVKWKFKPFKQDDKVVKVVSTLTFEFK